MPIINITIRDKIATAEKGALYVCGNSDYKVIFDFDEEWNDYDTKTARFIYGGSHTDVVFQGNLCRMPIISGTYGIEVGVFAGNLKTTTPAYVGATKSILCDSGSPAAPSDDVYNQIMELLKDDTGDDNSAEEVFYTSLIDAVAGKNAVSADVAKVKVAVDDTGRTVITLLDNVSESAQVSIDKDTDLVLNGKTLTLETANATLTFAKGTDCTIDGQTAGSKLEFVKFVSTASSASAITVNGNALRIVGGTYTFTGNCSGTCVVIKAASTCALLKMEGCVVDVANANATTAKYTRGIQSQATEVWFKDCEFKLNCGTNVQAYFGISKAEFDGCIIKAVGGNSVYGIQNEAAGVLFVANSNVSADAPGDNYDEPSSVGINNKGVCYINNGTIFGTVAGVSNSGELYVNGGMYTGFSHGGFYFSHGAEGVAFVVDAVTRCGNYEGVYENIFADRTKTMPYAAIYISGQDEAKNKDMVIYMDGCTIGDGVGRAITFSSSYGGHNNTLNISNSTVLGIDMCIRIDTNLPRKKYGERTSNHRVNVGVGTNIVDAMFAFIDPDTDEINPDSNIADHVDYSGYLYRKKHPSAVCDGADFAAIVNYLNAT